MTTYYTCGGFGCIKLEHPDSAAHTALADALAHHGWKPAGRFKYNVYVVVGGILGWLGIIERVKSTENLSDDTQ